VYYKAEIEEFCKYFYMPQKYNSKKVHPKLYACTEPARTRFLELEEDVREEFRKVVVGYRNLYAFLSQIIPFQDSDLEKLYSYLRFLLRRLPQKNSGPGYDFEDEVALKYYRLQKISEGSIALEKTKEWEVSGPTELGTGVAHEKKIELSRLIDLLNERFGMEFGDRDQLFYDTVKQDALSDGSIRQAAEVNPLENFGFVFLKKFGDFVIDRIETDSKFPEKILNDKEIYDFIGRHMMKEVYETIRAEHRS